MTRQFPSDPHRGARALTIVELLVVLALVVILVALLLPSLSHLRTVRQQVTCAAALRQIGVAAISYATASYGRLPTHDGDTTLAFDTFMMNQTSGEAVNLGLLADHMEMPEGFYCPTQTADASPALAFDSPSNKWNNPGKGKGKGKGKAKGQNNGGPSGGSPVAQVNSSFAARSRAHSGGVQLPWNIRSYANKVVYSDFAGVHEWQGTGRFTGGPIRAPHDATGYNRLFGNGSVQWVKAEALDPFRPVSATPPTAKQMHDYYQLMDVLP